MVADLAARAYPGMPILRVSAKTGQGFESLTDMLDRKGDYGRKILDIEDFGDFAAEITAAEERSRAEVAAKLS